MNITIKIDPLKKYPTQNTRQLLEACGILQNWLTEGEQSTLKARLLENYEYYIGEMNGGTLTNTGIYDYPGDPNMFALVSFETECEICFIFPFAIVGVFDKVTETTWVTRMD